MPFHAARIAAAGKNPTELILAKLHVAATGFFLLLPNIVGGMVLLIVAYIIGKLIAHFTTAA